MVETTCDHTQEFHATSPTASYGSTCGGFTVAFGPKGDLKRNRRYLWLSANWGDTPLTQANCAGAHLAAAAWGYLCANAACTSGAWERISPARTAHGTWNTVSNVCYLGIGANTGNKNYSTVDIDVIATQGQGRTAVRKRASASIHNMQPNGKCPTATYTPH